MASDKNARREAEKRERDRLRDQEALYQQTTYLPLINRSRANDTHLYQTDPGTGERYENYSYWMPSGDEGWSIRPEYAVGSNKFGLGELQAGDTFSGSDLLKYGREFAAMGTSPDPMLGLSEWLGKQGRNINNLSDLAWYQQNYGGMPLKFNPDGTVTYDPAARVNKFSFEKPETGISGFMEKAIPATALGLFGAGALGALSGGAYGIAPGSLGAAETAGTSWGDFLSQFGDDAFTNAGVDVGSFGSGAGNMSWSDFLGEMGDDWAFSNAGDAVQSFSSGGTFLDKLKDLVSQGGGSASTLAKLLGGSGGTNDWLSLAGKLGAAGLGAWGANEQQDAFNDLAQKYLDLGAPARTRLEASYVDPNSFLAGPDVQSILKQGSDAAARSLSTTYGNPALSPTAWSELMDYNTKSQWNQLYNYRNQLAAQGQLGVGPAVDFDKGAASGAGNLQDIGAGLLGDLTNPKKSLLEQMAEYTELGRLFGGGKGFGVGGTI